MANKILKTLTLPNAQGEQVTYELHPEWDKIENKPEDFILYTPQELTEAQKAQVRKNIGALPDTTVIPTVPSTLPNPSALTINGTAYNGATAVDMTDIINALIDSKLGVIENGSY